MMLEKKKHFSIGKSMQREKRNRYSPIHIKQKNGMGGGGKERFGEEEINNYVSSHTFKQCISAQVCGKNHFFLNINNKLLKNRNQFHIL